MTRYVVLVKPPDDDHPASVRIYGVYTIKATADWFAGKINEKIERHEEREWNRLGQVGDVETGWAYVLPIHKPVVVQGRRFGIHGSDALPIEQASAGRSSGEAMQATEGTVICDLP